MKGAADTKKVYLLAHPAGHSVSPAMHNAAFERLGIDAHYQALDVPADRLAATVESLRSAAVLGANVTVPHKLAVMPLLDSLSDAARSVGAVNTIVNRDGELHGDNTDAAGFTRALVDDAGVSLRGKKAVMLGAGGAARAVAYALLTAGVARLDVYNRTRERAEQLAGMFAHIGTIDPLLDDNLHDTVRGADLLVNTTTVGMGHVRNDLQEGDGASPLPLHSLPQRGFVCDIIYRPRKTKLLKDAEAQGLATQNGLAMLVYQGAESFRRWTGRDAPIEVMMEAADRGLG
ncbi:MAG: shikimate dehydrogenase [Trueperaceae bacterium]|nr:shikimate dehydrogenase [Trueperaceae bacterium]